MGGVQAGGAIQVGYTSFTAVSGCSAAASPPQPAVRVAQSVFSGNVATDRGGGISLQAGSLSLTVRPSHSRKLT